MRKPVTIILLAIAGLVAWGGTLYLAQDWGYHRGMDAKELESPRAFHCREALGQREMAQLGLDEDWRPEPMTIGHVTLALSTRQEATFRQERRERLVEALHEAETEIERFC